MAQLEENLKLGLEAVKYAKGQVRRSGNQHYYKSMTPFKDVKRNEFLLSATRGGSWIGDLNDKGEIFYTKDNLMSQRRKEIEQIIASSDPQSVKDKKIDKSDKADASPKSTGSSTSSAPPAASASSSKE